MCGLIALCHNGYAGIISASEMSTKDLPRRYRYVSFKAFLAGAGASLLLRLLSTRIGAGVVSL